MDTIKGGKLVNQTQLYDELVAAIPALAPTPTGPDGRLEAQLVIEQRGPRSVQVQVPDGTDAGAVAGVLAAHKREPEVAVDPVADAWALIEQLANQGPSAATTDDPTVALARAVMVLLR